MHPLISHLLVELAACGEVIAIATVACSRVRDDLDVISLTFGARLETASCKHQYTSLPLRCDMMFNSTGYVLPPFPSPEISRTQRRG